MRRTWVCCTARLSRTPSTRSTPSSRCSRHRGYTCTEFAFTDSNDVASVAQNAASGSDVIYIPTDNTAASCTEAIANVVIPAKVPVIAGEQGICSGCGVATLSIDYNELGQATGEMAYEILVKGANPGDMEVQAAPDLHQDVQQGKLREARHHHSGRLHCNRRLKDFDHLKPLSEKRAVFSYRSDSHMCFALCTNSSQQRQAVL